MLNIKYAPVTLIFNFAIKNWSVVYIQKHCWVKIFFHPVHKVSQCLIKISDRAKIRLALGVENVLCGLVWNYNMNKCNLAWSHPYSG